MNLVVNARDAMPRGGQLTIETGTRVFDDQYAQQHLDVQAARYAMMAVSDNGCGMTPEIQAQIFEPFFTTKPVGKGTGLGLATVHGIVRQSGGHVYVYSEPERGTSFKVYLPTIEQPEAEPVADGEREAPRGSETVLVVEDEDALREIIRICLVESGYTVLPAANASEAEDVSARHEQPIHLLVTDVVMPGLGGSDLAKRLSARRPAMKVLYISGYTDDAVVVREVLTGDKPFLEKPFTPDILARRVREVLGR
jgi:CheY-like chemotaxis protein